MLTPLSAYEKEVSSMPVQLYNRDEILEICLAEFAKHGYEKTSLVQIAKAAGISRTLIFHHFKSKKQLYLEIVDRIAEKASIEGFFGFLPQNSDFFKAREEYSRYKFNFVKSNPVYSCIMQEIATNPPAEVRDELRERYGELQVKYQKKWQELFEKVPLREGIDRKQAYEFVQMTLDYFDDKYYSPAALNEELDEAYFQRFLDERNCFLEMLRYGIQDR
jgi:TetR/AcrR family transcriptional regulator